MAAENYLIWGDSIPYGVGVSNVANSWPRHLADILGVTVNINAQPGENLQKLFGTNSLTNLLFEPTSDQIANQPVYPFDATFYRKWIVEPVINDARLDDQDQYNNITTFKAAYIRILNEFNRLGCPDSAIVLMNCGIDLNSSQQTLDRTTAFNGVISQIVSERPSIQLIDLHSFVAALPQPQSDYYADGLHYNESLTPLVAQFVADQLTNVTPPTPSTIRTIYRLGSGTPTSEPTFSNTLNSYEAMNTHAYYAATALKADGSVAVDGDSIDQFVEKKGSGYAMKYRGTPTPAIDGRPPYLRMISGVYPATYFHNVPRMEYFTDNFANQDGSSKYYTYPYSATYILTYLPLQASEAFVNNYGDRTLIGEINGTLRVGGDPNTAISDPTALPTFFKRTVLYIEYGVTEDGARYDNVWTNGLYKGRVLNTKPEGLTNSDGTPASPGNYGKIRTAIGVDTNCANFLFFSKLAAMGQDFVNIQNVRDAYQASIMAKWNAGVLESYPHINAALPVFNTTSRVWSVKDASSGNNITAVNSTPQQLADATYEWRIRTNQTAAGEGGGFAPQILISTNKTLAESEYQSYIDDGTGISINVLITIAGGEGVLSLARSIFSPYT